MDASLKGLNGKKLKHSDAITVPSSKSHTIRALLIASMADGESSLVNPLDSADARSCINACRSLGAEIETGLNTPAGLPLWKVRGTGGRFIIPEGGSNKIEIDVGNSGTTLYLAAGIAALSDSPIHFTGDAQIKRRPGKPLLDALADLGAEIDITGKDGCPPFTVRGPLHGGETSIECPTSQYLSSLLICSPLVPAAAADGAEAPISVINVPLLMEKPYVEMTLRWLDEQGINYEAESDFSRFRVPGAQRYSAFEQTIPGDFSSAAFPLCAAAITGSKLTLAGLDITDSQGDKAVIDYLRAMGCRIETAEPGTNESAAAGLITIFGPGHPECPADKLTGAELDLNSTPDALPAMAVAACFAEGVTRLYNVPQARLKETDRIAVMKQELSRLGAEIEELPDGLVIRCTDGSPRMKGSRVSGHGDHRVVMSLAVAALGCEGETIISDAEAVDITYPGFFEQLDFIKRSLF